MKFIKKLSLGLSLVLLSSQVAYAQTTVTEPQPEREPMPVEAQDTNKPSPWANWEVSMFNVYNLMQTDWFNEYKKPADVDDLYAVRDVFMKKFETEIVVHEDKNEFITREMMAYSFYTWINVILGTDVTDNDPITFMVQEGILTGNAQGDLMLDALATKEEVMVVGKRVYDYLIYQLDMASKGVYWTAEDEDTQVHLLGSIHVSDGSLFPLDQTMMQDFANSQALIVEAQVAQMSEEDIAYMNSIVMLEGDEVLSDKVDPDVYDAFIDLMKENGLTEEMVKKFKPWYAAMLASNLSMADSGYTGALGVDMYLLSLANGWKPVLEIEGLRFQLDMFDNMSDEMQEYYLASTLAGSQVTEDSESSANEQAIALMLQYWKDGNAKGLETILSDESNMSKMDKEFNDFLFGVRNENMIKHIDELLEEDHGGSYFLVVGAGHMVGDEGIVEGLKELGYTVE